MIYKLKVIWKKPDRNGKKTKVTFDIYAGNELLAKLELAKKLKANYVPGWKIL